jgi:hypothetical protein
VVQNLPAYGLKTEKNKEITLPVDRYFLNFSLPNRRLTFKTNQTATELIATSQDMVNSYQNKAL